MAADSIGSAAPVALLVLGVLVVIGLVAFGVRSTRSAEARRPSLPPPGTVPPQAQQQLARPPAALVEPGRRGPSIGGVVFAWIVAAAAVLTFGVGGYQNYEHGDTAGGSTLMEIAAAAVLTAVVLTALL